MRRFTATIDSLSTTITFVVIVVLIIPFITIGRQYMKLGDPRLLIGPAVTIAVLTGVFLYRIRDYSLDAAGLHIGRLIKPVLLPLHSIEGIMPITTKELGPGIRAFGSGGFLGYLGKFYYRAHGWITLYVTDRSKMLLITLAGDRKVIISPDDTAGFIAAFNDLKRK